MNVSIKRLISAFSSLLFYSVKCTHFTLRHLNSCNLDTCLRVQKVQPLLAREIREISIIPYSLCLRGSWCCFCFRCPERILKKQIQQVALGLYTNISASFSFESHPFLQAADALCFANAGKAGEIERNSL